MCKLLFFSLFLTHQTKQTLNLSTTNINLRQRRPFSAKLTLTNSAKKLRTNYIFGFQNQEMDDEVKGEGNSVNYKYRMHDPRLGRFFAIDPLSKDYPYYSPYQFGGNRPVDCVELEGLEPRMVTKGRLRISNRAHSDGTGNSRIGLHLYPKWKRGHVLPAPVDDCFEFKTIIVPVVIRTLITEQVVSGSQGEENLIDDLGFTEIGANTSNSYKAGGAHSINWDPHGAPDKISVTNLSTGEIIETLDGVLSKTINIPCGIPFKVDIEGKGTYGCEIYETPNVLITNTKVYRDGILVLNNDFKTPTTDCPREKTIISDEKSKDSREKRVKVPCGQGGDDGGNTPVNSKIKSNEDE